MRIVVVEQSSVGLKILCSMIRDAGYDAVPFQDGGVALAFIQSDLSIDLLLTSLEVPSVSGLQLCWEARLLAMTRPLYVIAMSSTYDGPTLEKALDSGADDFIMKPPDRRQLGARLRAAERLITAQRSLLNLATYDPLTNLLNRRAFTDRARILIEQAADAAQPAVALICDVDHFKRVNDAYGHDVGDEVLCQVADILGKGCQISGRLGGEEFAACFANKTEIEVFRAADAIRAAIAAAQFETALGTVAVSASFGLAVLEPGDTMRTLLKRADQALYSAKAAGRNRVVVFRPGSDGEVDKAA